MTISIKGAVKLQSQKNCSRRMDHSIQRRPNVVEAVQPQKTFKKIGVESVLSLRNWDTVFKIELYENKTPETSSGTIGKTGQVVPRLAERLPKNRNYKLFFDNWFSSRQLIFELLKKRIFAVGTLRINRARRLVFSSLAVINGCDRKDEERVKRKFSKWILALLLQRNGGTTKQ